MKRKLLLVFLIAQLLQQTAYCIFKDPPDSVYLFSYATSKDNNHNGLHFAWSPDRKNWYSIGNEFSFVRSDYGRWGTEKRMLSPYLVLGDNGVWHCVWSLNERDKVFAHASSADLIEWNRQSYPEVKSGKDCLRPVIQYVSQQKQYIITYTDSNNRYYSVITKDFKTYTPASEVPAAKYKNTSFTLELPTGSAIGQLHRVAWKAADKLIKASALKQYENSLYNESTGQDAQRFSGLNTINAAITVQPEKAKSISDMLLGVFFEDLNYAADGGLYAELIQNRDFEYRLSDKEGHDKNWTSTHSWELKGANTNFFIDSIAPLHRENPHYAVLKTSTPGAMLVNSGFDGITLKKGEQYNLSFFLKQLQGKDGKLLARLVDKNGQELARTTVSVPSDKWTTASAVLVPDMDASNVMLELQPLSAGSLALDMISLFPQHTFKERKNGLRADLAQTIANIHPRFVRFPGGCVAHGDGLENIYRWKNTIGPLEARKPQRNLWGYHQSAGLGYFEYFQFCEDIGAQPLPVIAAGVPCQNSATGGAGQQGGIAMNKMDEYIRDILDLIEYANGDTTTTWGKKRAVAGHPEPFHLKYIGIGNEDLITDIFEERFAMIFKALQKTHPEITVIGTVGPSCEGTDYNEGWKVANRLKVPMVDEHYYQKPGWFVNNQNFYDKYDRSKSKVYLGEYASWSNSLESALSEALYLTSLERNGDVVSMASYAPLLAKEGHTQWNPDLIYFNNNEVKPTVNYYVQELYGRNPGNQYLPAIVTLSDKREDVKKRVGISVVRDTQSKDIIIKMVNLLPVAVNTSIDLKGISIIASEAVKTILQGNPADKNVKPDVTTFPVSEKFTLELKPYSFTVIRAKTN